MVVDTSIILSILFNEKHGSWASDQLEKYDSELRMSIVNLSECLILLEHRQPQLFEELKDWLMNSSIRFVSATVSHAVQASSARLKFSKLNMGDCFAYALAKEEHCPLLTLDISFRQTDLDVVLPSR